MAVQKFGLAIDWETSGYSVPHYAKEHQGISVGALIFEIATFDIVETLYLEIKFDDTKYKWEEDAERVHGLSREHLAKHGVTQQEAATQLATMILKYIGTDKIVALGHRVFFDIEFTNQLMSSVDFELNWDPIKLDSAAIALTFLGVNKSDELFELMGMPPRGSHDAMEDIVFTLSSVKAIRDYFIAGLTST